MKYQRVVTTPKAFVCSTSTRPRTNDHRLAAALVACRLIERAATTHTLALLLRLLAVATVSLTLARCDCGGDIRAEDYDQSCDIDEDCVAVADGNKCDIERCGCPFTGINAEELERFQRDLDQIPCARNPLGGVQCSCISVEAACDEGTCGVRRLE